VLGCHLPLPENRMPRLCPRNACRFWRLTSAVSPRPSPEPSSSSRSTAWAARTCEILRPECRITPQEVGFRYPLPPRLLQDPHRNPGSHDARFSPADSRRVLNSREGIAKIPRDPLEKLRLFAAAERLQLLLQVVKRTHRSRLPFRTSKKHIKLCTARLYETPPRGGRGVKTKSLSHTGLRRRSPNKLPTKPPKLPLASATAGRNRAFAVTLCHWLYYNRPVPKRLRCRSD